MRDSNRLTVRQAHTTVRTAARLAGHRHVAAALATGTASPQQCRGIIDGLEALPGELDPALMDDIEQRLVGFVDRHDPDELRRLAHRALEAVAPDLADEVLRESLERQEALARRSRRLTWARDGHGSVFFRAKLPTVEAEQLIGQINAWVARAERLEREDSEGADPGYLPPTLDQQRADALMRIVETAIAQAAAPVHGGDRPRMTVVVDFEDLLRRVGVAELLDSGQPVSVAAVRHLACDADIVPVVLGGPSQPLDLGRTLRLVSGDLRQAVHLRDRGCAFPGCDREPRSCEAHHIVPWAEGGPTALHNLVLLCRHHHGLVEPDPRSMPGSRWEVRMGADQLPEFLPPARAGSTRQPRRHTRYALREPGSPEEAAA